MMRTSPYAEDSRNVPGRRQLPEPPLTRNNAVVAAAALVVDVVPMVLGSHELAVCSLRGDAEVNQKPRKVPAQPGAPRVGMALLVDAHCRPGYRRSSPSGPPPPCFAGERAREDFGTQSLAPACDRKMRIFPKKTRRNS